MTNEKVGAVHNGERRIQEISLMKNIKKAVIIEGNNVYTYGYKSKENLDEN